jgi:type IV pilus assembly protein PilY1
MSKPVTETRTAAASPLRPIARLSLAALLLGPGLSQAASTDLATAPLETSTSTLVKPNIFFILDNSGSMASDYLPDWAVASSLCQYLYVSRQTTGNCGTTATDNANKLAKNSRVNGVYYDPAVTYSPPKSYDGSDYKSMTSANTSAWKQVPSDGFGIQSTSTSDLVSTSPVFYTFVAGEYCTTAALRTCVTQSAASTAYPYPAYLRWCTSTALSTCQASRIETAPSGGSTYLYPRYPGATTSANATVPGSVITTTISSSTTSYTYPNTDTRASTRTDCKTNTSTCTYAEEMTNYANWWAYYHTRMQMMKTAASLALIDLSTSYRLGFMSINNNKKNEFLDIADITTTSDGQKSKFYTKLFASTPDNSTPLKKALYTAGRYFAGKLSSINSVTASDPMQYACQRNYTLLSTDGYWNETTTPTQIDGSTAIGDQDGSSSGEPRPYLDGNNTSNTLADVAEYYYKTDIRSSTFKNTTNTSTGTDVSSNSYSNGQQRMYTYTLGLGASGYMQFDSNYASATSGDYYDVANGTSTSATTLSNGVCIWQSSGSCNWPTPTVNTQTAIDDLWHAAVNGRGSYYSAANPTELKTGLSNFVTAVSAATSSSASATASNPNLSTSTSNYVYATSFCSAKWFGELARYTIDAATGEIASTPDWSQSGAGNDCTSSSSTLTTTALLDDKSWSSRSIYTYDPGASSGSTLISFAWASLNSTMQGYFKVAAISSLSQMCSSGSNCLAASAKVDSTTAGTSTGVGGINLVNYLRGDRSNEGSSNTKYYFPRTHVLGDIVNAQALYVQKPSYSYSDTGYSEFKTANANRTAMVYGGANDGMLHAFNADTGAELWAYIPSMLLPKLYKLADKNYAANHVNLVDGSIAKADVYYDGAWHSIIVGGLGEGGRGFYALDVTTPSSPKVLWEFTHDTSASSSYIRDEDLGYSYGKPVTTKLSDGTWAVLVTSGYNNVSPGSGYGIVWVLNAQTGAIIKKIDNGVGSNASGSLVTGCSALPCPSGLAKISAWVDSASNNTATRVYGGDLYGNLWRFDISALTASGGTVSTQLLATLSDASGTRQPVTTTPELGYTDSSSVVYVGTGRYLGVSDVTTTQTQSIYAIKDPLTGSSSTAALYSSPRTDLCSSSVTTDCFVKNVLSDSGGVRSATSTVSYAVDMSSMNGWFEDLPVSGERINTDPVLSNGTLTYVSNVPTTSSACATGGSSYINYVSYSTGLAVDGNDAGALLSSTAMGSGVSLVTTTDGTTRGVVTLSDGSTSVQKVPTSSSNTSTRRISWRELIVGE